MKAAMRIIFIICIVVWSITALAIYLSNRPPEFESFTTPEFTCDIPKDCPSTPIVEGEWAGYSFQSMGRPRISYYTPGGEIPDNAMIHEIIEKVPSVKYSRNMSMMKGAIFLLVAEGRTRRYVYLINSGKRLFWIESGANSSTALEIKEIADRMALSLSADGCSASPASSREIAETNVQIIRYAQSSQAILLLLPLVFAVISLLAFVLFKLGGKIPSNVSGPFVRQEEDIYFVRRARMQYNGSVGAIVLTDKDLTLYHFGKPMLVVHKGESSIVEIKGEFIFIKGGVASYELHVANPTSWLADIKAQLE